MDLQNLRRIKIAEIDPSTDLRKAYIKGRVAVIWPFSHREKALSVLLVESDYRQRENHGEVRVQLYGPAAEALAASLPSIGDEVVLRLLGGRLSHDTSQTPSPARSVGWELQYENRLVCKVSKDGALPAVLDVAYVPNTKVPETPGVRRRRETSSPARPVPKRTDSSNLTWALPSTFGHGSSSPGLDNNENLISAEARSEIQGTHAPKRQSDSWVFLDRYSTDESVDGSEQEGESRGRGRKYIKVRDTSASQLTPRFDVKGTGRTSRGSALEEATDVSSTATLLLPAIDLKASNFQASKPQSGPNVEQISPARTFEAQNGNVEKVSPAVIDIESLEDDGFPANVSPDAKEGVGRKAHPQAADAYAEIVRSGIENQPSKEPPISQEIFENTEVSAKHTRREIQTRSRSVREAPTQARQEPASEPEERHRSNSLSPTPSRPVLRQRTKPAAVATEAIREAPVTYPDLPPYSPMGAEQSRPAHERGHARALSGVYPRRPLSPEPSGVNEEPLDLSRSGPLTEAELELAEQILQLQTPIQSQHPPTDYEHEPHSEFLDISPQDPDLTLITLPSAPFHFFSQDTLDENESSQALDGRRDVEVLSIPGTTDEEEEPPEREAEDSAKGENKQLVEPDGKPNEEPEAPIKKRLRPSTFKSGGNRTSTSYLVALHSLSDHFSRLVDTIAVVVEATEAVRAKAGPRHAHRTITLIDPTTDGSPPSFVSAYFFRRSKSALPFPEKGNAILLRDFRVQTEKHNATLVSTDTSSWAIFGHQGLINTIGPPVEFGDDDLELAQSLVKWWDGQPDTA